MRDSQKRLLRLVHLSFALVLVVGLLATQGIGAPLQVAHAQGTAIQTFPDPINNSQDACTENTLPANDDGSSPAISMPFPLNFAGAPYQSLFVNNNGNITFNRSQTTYTPYGLV